MDEILAEGLAVLNKFDWGCQTGDHTGYAVVDAENETTVRNMIPTFLRTKARVVKVGKLTPEQISPPFFPLSSIGELPYVISFS